MELWALLGTTVVLWMAIFLQQIHADRTSGTAYALSNRDGPPPGATATTARLSRVVRNHVEGLAVFAPLVIVAAVAGVSNIWTQYAAVTVFGARLLHFVFYAAGITPFRSIAWGTGFLLAIPAFLYGIAGS
ncbi:MAG: MAPEG family protein [Myxococcota bacterium]